MLTVEIGEVSVLDVGTRAKVDQLKGVCFQIHKDILVLFVLSNTMSC